MSAHKLRTCFRIWRVVWPRTNYNLDICTVPVKVAVIKFIWQEIPNSAWQGIEKLQLNNHDRRKQSLGLAHHPRTGETQHWKHYWQLQVRRQRIWKNYENLDAYSRCINAKSPRPPNNANLSCGKSFYQFVLGIKYVVERRDGAYHCNCHVTDVRKEPGSYCEH